MELCKNCVCQPVCAVYYATGGIARCEHYHAIEAFAKKLPADEAVRVELTMMCSRCKCHMLPQDHICPGCGAIMEEEK